jgi:hypothetical protein
LVELGAGLVLRLLHDDELRRKKMKDKRFRAWRQWVIRGGPSKVCRLAALFRSAAAAVPGDPQALQQPLTRWAAARSGLAEDRNTWSGLTSTRRASSRASTILFW